MTVVLLLTVTLAAAFNGQIVTGELFCSKEWILALGSCYRQGPDKMTFDQAKSQCGTWGSHLRVITSDSENKLFRDPPGKGNQHWLGIVKKIFDWTMERDGKDVVIKYHPPHSSISDFGSFSHFGEKRDCILWDSQYITWKAEKCHSSSNYFICQKDPAIKCPPGRFGNNCTSECHCKGQEPCDAYTGVCPRGCQLGWSGPSCGKEKGKAKAKFYCFKIKKQNTLMLRVNQRGTIYRTVTAYNKDGKESPGCDRSHFEHFEVGGMATLKVTQEKGVFKPACGEDQEKGGVVTWRFKFQEFPVMSSVADILFEVTCHFTTAESLTSLEASTIEIPPPRRVKVKESQVSVSFHIVDPYTNEPLTKVKLGQEVKLNMQLNHSHADELGVTAISPYDCAVSSPDGRRSVVFKDEDGCTPKESRIFLSPYESSRLHSATFEAFTLPSYTKVNFRCSYHVCFKEGENCQTCNPSEKRKIKTRPNEVNKLDKVDKKKHDGHAFHKEITNFGFFG